MNKILLFLVGAVITFPTYAVPNNATPNRTAVSSRATVGTVSVNKKSSLKWDQANFNQNVVTAEQSDPERDRRRAERAACLGNNIGIQNTFVWASRYSDTSNYSTMVEDTEHPENNVCFAYVELRSNDKNINLSDINGKYFQMNTNVNCGSWVDKNLLEKRILDGKKSTRTLATVAGAVGGAGVGVGAMELFGNNLIGGAVKGQQALSGDALFIAQLKELKNNGSQDYNDIVTSLKEIRTECNNTSNDDCKKIDYDTILTALGE